MPSTKLGGLAVVNVELTSRCNKKCWMCGRRKIERDYPELSNWGDMPKDMAISLAKELPKGIVVQFHNNGEPLLYPDLYEIGWQYHGFIRHFDTNGKLLAERWSELVCSFDVITVSIVQDDPEADEQYRILEKVKAMHAGHPPRIVLRLLGKVDRSRYEKFGWPIITRTLHSPMGSYEYEKQPTRLEYDVCLDLLTHLSIDRFGTVRPCVRFDPYNENIIGDYNKQSLVEIWHGEKRREYISSHVSGKRARIPFCAGCDYYGVPLG